MNDVGARQSRDARKSLTRVKRRGMRKTKTRSEKGMYCIKIDQHRFTSWQNEGSSGGEWMTSHRFRKLDYLVNV